jgi:hypothetical protein
MTSSGHDPQWEVTGSTPWRLKGVSRDGRVLELEIRVDSGPGVEAEVIASPVVESQSRVEVGVEVRQSYPPRDSYWVGESRFVTVRLSEPLGDRTMIAAPVDPDFAERIPYRTEDLGLPGIDDEM